MKQAPADQSEAQDSAVHQTTQSRGRLLALDLLRGAIVAVMSWDHCKDFLADYAGHDGTYPGEHKVFGTHSEQYAGPLELYNGKPVYFLARFVSHMCAPGKTSSQLPGPKLCSNSYRSEGLMSFQFIYRLHPRNHSSRILARVLQAAGRLRNT